MIAVAIQLLVVALNIGLTVWLCVVTIPDVIRAIRETERETERIKRETEEMRSKRLTLAS